MSKRLVKNDLNWLDWEILNYLKTNAVGVKNAVSGNELVDYYGLTSTQVLRHHIKKLRNSDVVDIVIGSNNKGYYIPLKDEYEESMRLLLSKTLSQIKTVVKLYPRAAHLIHAITGQEFKTVDKAVDGQYQIQFNGWEREVIKRFGKEKLIKELENE